MAKILLTLVGVGFHSESLSSLTKVTKSVCSRAGTSLLSHRHCS